ncbi:hypothetical protein BU15DRAFT_49739 [Melanogaster broomeanus]|nr:hypothetical protein BU15DRAFT_49739 [Melanogaster broomeanus]
MRLIFSSSYYKNTDISDEQGNKLYNISTPRGRKQVTTVTKYRKGKRGKRTPEVLGVIEWHRVKKTLFRFGRREVEADMMVYKRPWSCRGRSFRGPDGRTYKWKIGFRYCWRKHSRVRLVKFHKRNLGIRKPSHPPYLDVSSDVTHMLDHIIMTYIYVERIRQDTEDDRP